MVGSTCVPDSSAAFDGQIAVFRYCDGRLSWHDVVDNYNAVAGSDLVVPEPATMGLLARRRKRA